MDLKIGKALLIGLAIATATALACTDGPTQAPTASTDQGTGVVGLRLQVAPGVTISTLQWTIHNPTLLAADLTGTVDVSQSQAIQFVVGGIPSGPGYTITLTATTDGPNGLSCVGSAMFAVVANTTSAVSVSLVCSSGGTGTPDANGTGSILVNGTTTIAASCAAVTSLSASPSTVDVGSSIALSATGIDSLNSTSNINFAWAVTGGTGTGSFSDANAATPSFTCTGAGPVTVTVTATTPAGGTCPNNTASTDLTCTTPNAADSGAAADAGAPDTGAADTGAPDTGAPDTGTPDTGTPDAGEPDTGTPDTSTADTGTPDTGTPDTGTPDTGTPDVAPPPGPCDPTNPNANTTTCFNSVTGAGANGACLACAQAAGCLDGLTGGGSCEQGALTTTNATLLTAADGGAATLPDGKTCAQVVAPASVPVTERQVCLEVLSTVFSSLCGASTQLTPCLCGATDPATCLAGTATPTGAAFDLYACDFLSTSGSTINAIQTNFPVPTFGAGAANNALSCAGAFGCHCLGD